MASRRSDEGRGMKSHSLGISSAVSVPTPHSLPFYLPYVVPVMTLLAHYSATPWHSLMPALFVWGIIPILDLIFDNNESGPSRHLSWQQRKALESRMSFKLAVYLWCPTQLGMLYWAACRLTENHDTVCGVRLVGLLCSVGLMSAEGINCSHELLHRRSQAERFLGKLLLTSVCYGHFTIEHARGHHTHVATPEDPATLRFGESFYHFLPRTVLGGYRSAWRLEAMRLKRYGLPVWSLSNEMILFALGQAAFCAFFYFSLGPRALMLFLYQSANAIILLEQVNAIEHYGLVRRKLPSGEYERVGPRHSWDAPHRISSYLLFKLQVHADHHLYAAKRYQTLHLTDGSPQLPAGYLNLLPLLLIPPLWRAVMDPVLNSYKKKWEIEDGKVTHMQENECQSAPTATT